MTSTLAWLFANTYILSGPGRETIVFKPEADKFDVKLVNLDKSLVYELRSYAPGFAYGFYSPEKARVAEAEEFTVNFSRTWKSDVRRLPGDELVVTLDPMVWGLVPSAVMEIIWRCLAVVAVAIPSTFVFRSFLICN